MTITNTEVRTTKPTHPGEMLREDFMPDFGLTAASLAEALGVSRQTINEILREELNSGVHAIAIQALAPGENGGT